MKSNFGDTSIPQSAIVIPELDANFETRVFAAKNNKQKEKQENETKLKSSFISGKSTSKFIKASPNKEAAADLQALKNKWNATLAPVEERVETKVKIKVPKKHKDLAARVKTKETEIYNFFIEELLPTCLAISPALEKTVQNAAHILETDVEVTIANDFYSMINDALTLKLFDCVSDSMGVQEELKQIIKLRYFSTKVN